MTFVSAQWLGWIIGTAAIYWLIPSQGRKQFLLLASAFFLFTADWASGLFLITLSAATYFLSNRQRFRGRATILAIFLVTCVLAYYKVRVSTAPLDVIRSVAMPLGLSYYSFRMVHYLIEKARGTLPAHRILDYVGYLFFLPTIVVGPIHRFPDFMRASPPGRLDFERILESGERILIGYFKVIVLGNFLLGTYLARKIGAMSAAQKPLVLYLEAARGSVNLYLQFSGYSDIAIGFGLLLGYQVMENFNWPYFRSNIAEFWRCWHISLTSWARDYIYMPVVGLTRQPVYGTVACLLIIGIWHELSVRYVLWGLYHGLGIIAVNQLRRYLRKRKLAPVRQPALHRLLYAGGVLLTANYFILGYVITSQKTISDMLAVYSVIFFGWR